MAEELGSGDVRAAKVAAMGPSLGELHFALWEEVTWIHLKWKDFRTLFASSAERIDILNKAAPDFFGNLQRVLWEDILLHLCRLTDPPRSMGHPNLGLTQLTGIISDNSLREKINELVKCAEGSTAFARAWRNRRLAHRELPDFADSDSKPLPGASRQHVEEALFTIRDAMNCIELHYTGSSVGYQYAIEALGGVDSLIKCIERGL